MSKKRTSSQNQKLNLLERLVKDPGEATPEQQILLDTLIKESGGSKFYHKENGKYIMTRNGEMKNKSSSSSQVKKKSLSKETDKKPNGLLKIDTGIEKPEMNGHSRSRSNSASSDSSFWSSGSKDRSRARSRSRSHSRSGSSSRSRSYSRSSDRSKSQSSTDSRSRCRSGSFSGSSRSRSRSNSIEQPSHSTVQSVPVRSGIKSSKAKMLVRDTASDQGDTRPKKPPSGAKGHKPLKRKKMKNYRSIEINPDVFIEERLRQKYRELDDIMRGQTVRTQTITRQHLGQMQTLQEQYHMVSHGLTPPGILVPRSLPSSVRQGRLSSGIRQRPWSGNTDTSEFSNDIAYGTIKNVIDVSRAKERNLLAPDVQRKKKKKKARKRKDSESTLENITFEDVPSQISSMGSKAASTPRSMAGLNKTDNHIKDSGNPKLLRWLKEKDKEHRKKTKEDRRQKREEREKTVLEANEKFEKRLEAQKIYKKWLDKKNREIVKRERSERKERKMAEKLAQEREMNNELSLRPKSAQLNSRDSSGGITVEGNSNTNVNIKAKTDEAKVKSTPHPPASKFIYKRPVAGRIKLKMNERNEEKGRPQSAHVIGSKTSEETMQRQRMSYDDWILRKRREDQKKKHVIEQRKKDQMSKSDPELNKLIPEIAKKRIHNVLEGKKRIDTGIKSFDEQANNSFGGADFGKDEISESQEVRYSYRLDDSNRSATSLGSARGGKPPPATRPKTAPHGGSRVIPPKQSSGSPRKAIVPAKVEDIMSNEDNSNPFRLPFPEEQGVPKHVAAKQRQLFAERVWQKIENEERPEPQGSDAQEPPTCVSVNKQAMNEEEENVNNEKDIGDEESRETYENSNGQSETTDSKVFLTQFNSVDNLTNIVNQQSQPAKSVESESRNNTGESGHSQTGGNDNESETDYKQDTENEPNLAKDENAEYIARTEESENPAKEVVNDLLKNAEKINENFSSKGCDEPEDEDEEELYEELPEELTDDTENVETDDIRDVKDTEDCVKEREKDDEEFRPESVATSRSSKRVSFREEPDVFTPQIEEGSTDTQTPDGEEHVKFFDGDVDVSASLNDEEGRDIKNPTDSVSDSVTNSLDDDF